MKKFILLVILAILIIFNFTYAQNMVAWENIANSAFTPNGEIVVNIDVAQDTINMDSLFSKIFYSMDNQQSWNTVDMNLMNEPGYEMTFTQTINLSAADSVIYGFKAGYPANVDTLSDSLYLTMSPKSETGYFPPQENWLTELCPESDNDAQGASGKPFLELIDIQVSFSEEQFIFSLDNADNEWPLYEFFPSLPPWYVYAIGLKNPEDFDSTGYAMIYADIPAVGSFPGIETGLYKGNLADSSYSQIANIDQTINQGNLYLACDIADLINDPDFGPWPNSSGSILTGVAITTISLAGMQPSFTINDYSHPTLFFPENVHSVANDTTAPALSDLTYETVNDSFKFTITYTDAGNNLALIRKLVTTTSEYTLHSADHSYDDGSEFEAIVSVDDLNDGPVYAEFNDGIHSAISNTIVIDNIDNEYSPQVFLTNVRPNPFKDKVRISLNLNSKHPNDVFHFNLSIYNLKGQKIEEIPAIGENRNNELEFIWNGKNQANNRVKAGVYFYKFNFGGEEITGKILLMK